MTSGTITNDKPRGVLRWFLRMPIWLYRFHLGWLMGNRFIMLKHTGRKSSLARYAVIEVVNHDTLNNIYTVGSGWGEKSDWFKNILKTPEVQITTYKGKLQVKAVRLTANEGAQMLQLYAQKHPSAFNALTKMMMGGQDKNKPVDIHKLAEILPVVSFIPEA